MNIEMNTIDPELIFLKAQITIARKKLNQVWSERGKTDAAVLAVGNELDRLINEYERKKNNGSCCQVTATAPVSGGVRR